MSNLTTMDLLFGDHHNGSVTRVHRNSMPLIRDVIPTIVFSMGALALFMILPPALVLKKRGCGKMLAVNIFLTVLFLIPGWIHACIVTNISAVPLATAAALNTVEQSSEADRTLGKLDLRDQIPVLPLSFDPGSRI